MVLEAVEVGVFLKYTNKKMKLNFKSQEGRRVSRAAGSAIGRYQSQSYMQMYFYATQSVTLPL